MPDPPDGVVLPVCAEDAIGDGLADPDSSTVTPDTASGGSHRPWVPSTGATTRTSGVLKHVDNEGEPAGSDPGALRHRDDTGRPVQEPGGQVGPR